MAISIDEYRELQIKQEEPRRKYLNVKVQACPVCWYELKPNIFRDNCDDFRKGWRDCQNCNKTYSPRQFIIFDSKVEWGYGLMLKKREERGEISNLVAHPLYQMDGLNYKPDFRYTDNHGLTVVDVKGLNRKTQLPIIHNSTVFKIKLNKMFEQHGIEVEIVAGGHAWVIDQRKLKQLKLIKIY